MSEDINIKPIEVLKQKRGLLLSMFGIMQSNNELLQSDRIDEFKDQEKKVQQIIKEINLLNLALSKMRQQQKENFAAQNVVGMKNDIKNIIKKIISMNKKNNDIAEEKVRLYKNQIKNLNHAKKGKAYTKSKANNAIFVDAKK